MTTYISKIIYIGLIALALNSCGTHRASRVSDQGTRQISRELEIKEHLIAQRSNWTALKASLRAEIEVGQKNFSSRVNLSAARGKGLRLSVVPFPLVEAARLWFTPEGITMVDLINGRYASEDYASLSDRLGFLVGYEQIEALFLARVFAPNEADQEAGIRKLKHQVAETKHSLKGALHNYAYHFSLSADALLESFVVSAMSSGDERFRASYNGYSDLEGRLSLPQEVSYELYKPKANGATIGKLTLEYNKITLQENAEGLGLEPKIKPQYERIDLSRILQLINRQ